MAKSAVITTVLVSGALVCGSGAFVLHTPTVFASEMVKTPTSEKDTQYENAVFKSTDELDKAIDHLFETKDKTSPFYNLTTSQKASYKAQLEAQYTYLTYENGVPYGGTTAKFYTINTSLSSSNLKSTTHLLLAPLKESSMFYADGSSDATQNGKAILSNGHNVYLNAPDSGAINYANAESVAHTSGKSLRVTVNSDKTLSYGGANEFNGSVVISKPSEAKYATFIPLYSHDKGTVKSDISSSNENILYDDGLYLAASDKTHYVATSYAGSFAIGTKGYKQNQVKVARFSDTNLNSQKIFDAFTVSGTPLGELSVLKAGLQSGELPVADLSNGSKNTQYFLVRLSDGLINESEPMYALVLLPDDAQKNVSDTTNVDGNQLILPTHQAINGVDLANVYAQILGQDISSNDKSFNFSLYAGKFGALGDATAPYSEVVSSSNDDKTNNNDSSTPVDPDGGSGKDVTPTPIPENKEGQFEAFGVATGRYVLKPASDSKASNSSSSSKGSSTNQSNQKSSTNASSSQSMSSKAVKQQSGTVGPHSTANSSKSVTTKSASVSNPLNQKESKMANGVNSGAVNKHVKTSVDDPNLAAQNQSKSAQDGKENSSYELTNGNESTGDANQSKSAQDGKANSSYELTNGDESTGNANQSKKATDGQANKDPKSLSKTGNEMKSSYGFLTLVGVVLMGFIGMIVHRRKQN